MSYQERIRNKKSKMSKSFAKLANYLLDSTIEASFMTATELAHELNLDTATVVRFSQYLGYPGFPQLIKEIRERVKYDLLIRPKEAEIPNTLPSIVYKAIDDLITAIEQTKTSLNTETIEKFTEEIDRAKRIFILASNPAQPAVYNLVHSLEQGNYPIYTVRTGLTDIARVVHASGKDDLLLAIDVSNENPYIASALQQARQKGTMTATIVNSPSLPTARAAELVLAARGNPTLGINIATIEAIVYALVQALRWRNQDRFLGVEQSISDIIERIQSTEV